MDIGSPEYWVRITLFCFGVYGLDTLLIAMRAQRRGASKRRLFCLVVAGLLVSVVVAAGEPGLVSLGLIALVVLLPLTAVDSLRMSKWRRAELGAALDAQKHARQ